ncbi:uncharacterized protein [Diadema antillarum]|uniref:uncharacterized protein n=1 Tax=Diadema antillarum TaxID=105358 RepID=UPI003A8619B2
MNVRKKGMAFILNNNNFMDQRKRKGSEVDEKNVTHVFREIGYEIVIEHDLTADEIKDALASLKSKIRISHTSAVLVFMSHGDREGICGKDGKVITVEEIKETFSGRNCPELREKPKIFFFQACRGDKLTTRAADKSALPASQPYRSITSGAVSFNSVDIGDESGEGVSDGTYAACKSSKSPQVVELDSYSPDNAHMLIAHATCEGYVALRDNVNGSWFIQALCEELIAGAHLYDLSAIMTKVSGRVQRQRGCVRHENGTEITYQTTQTVSQGIVKKIYFLPKYPPYTYETVSRCMKTATRNHGSKCCRYFKYKSKGRVDSFKHPWVKDGLAEDGETGLQVVIKGRDTLKDVWPDLELAMVDYLIKQKKLKVKPCTLSSYSALITSPCAPGDIVQCDQRCTFSCSVPGPTPTGHAGGVELTCCENGAWSDALPTCPDIFPDTDGSYTQEITSAQPTEEQLDPNESYSMNLRKKGMAFVLKNNDFVDRGKRKGSEVDVKNVTHVFQEIGYKVIVVQDLTADEIRDALASLKTKIQSSHTSAVLVFMSHGDREGICGKDGKVISVEEIKDIFSGRNCPNLCGKPKIFFFQACRGDKVTTSAADKPVQPIPRTDRSNTRGVGSYNPVDIGDESGEGVNSGAYAACQTSGSPQPVEFDNVPDNAHMFIAHATCEGYVALRDNINGSWFIQALCEELIAGAHLYDLSTIMNKVSGRVQRQRGCLRQEKGRVIIYQTTQTISQGIVKKLYFLPKYPPKRFAAVSLSMDTASRNHVV